MSPPGTGSGSRGAALWAGLLTGILAASVSLDTASASAWNLPKGQGQAIIKFEDIRAADAFTADGERVGLPGGRRDQAMSVLVEYGLNARFTLQMKGEWQDGRDAYADYQGRGPIEVGVRWQAYRDDRQVAAVYVGHAQGGEGRNAGYAMPGAGDSDWEVRLLAARTFGGTGDGWLGQGAFVEVQAARLWRSGLPDEARLDLTGGVHLNDDWMVLVQAFAGASDGVSETDGARWLSVERSVVRRFGDWSLQAGWRQTLAGRETPAGRGPVFGIWRRF